MPLKEIMTEKITDRQNDKLIFRKDCLREWDGVREEVGYKDAYTSLNIC